MPLLSLTQVGKLFGAVEVFSALSLGVERGDHLALVGPNGAGKTTLLRLMAGLERPDSGTVTFSRGLKIGYLPQEARFHSERTLREAMLNVFAGLRRQAARLRELEAELAAGGKDPTQWERGLLDEYTAVLARFEERGGYTYENRVEQVLSGLGFPRDAWDRRANTLSGGQRTRAHLARLLLESPDMLLLDEPTNHLDLATTEWLENFLATWSGALVIVSHDRYFLDRTTRRTAELVDNHLDVYPAPYSRFVELRAERHAGQNKEYRAQQEEIARTEDFIRRFKAGGRSREARGRATRLARVERLQQAPSSADLHLHLDVSGDAGHIILTTLRLRAGFPTQQLLHVPNMQVERGARIALIGPNGAGKSTLLRTLTGELKATGGTFQWGVNVDVGYYAQGHEGLHANHTVLEEVQRGHAMSEEDARTYLGRFLFSGDDVFKKIRELSGGQRSRVALAKLTLQRANVLLLDEPTNHLDIGARGALETVLKAYPGSLLFVSHDRYFITALATEIWAIEDGVVRVYRGSYADYLAKREKGLYQPELPDAVTTAGSAGGTARPQRMRARGGAARAAALDTPDRAPRGAVDSRLLPFVERLALLEREERALVRQITSPAGVDLPRLLDLSAAYSGVQEGIAAQDELLIAALRGLLAEPIATE